MAPAAMTMRMLRFAAGAIILSGCSDDPTGNLGKRPATVGNAVVTANPHNVLSAIVLVAVDDGDSVAVVVQRADSLLSVDTSAAVAANQGPTVIPVLGLRPSTTYMIRPIAWAGEQVTRAEHVVQFTTGDLPADIPSYSARGSDPSRGFVIFATGPYAIAIDNSGRVVWYRRFSGSAGLAFVAQADGRYYARPTTTDPSDLEHWTELDALGNIVRTLPCDDGLVSRPHDLIVRADGSYWLMCDDTREVDLSGDGGVASAKVTGTAIQHLSRDGRVLFQWSPFDHLKVTDLDPSLRGGSNVNWTHGNALDIDAEGNIMISFRNLEEITRINSTTGSVISRLGGRKNQFSLEDSPNPPFAQQHSARFISANEIILLDNVGNPGETRAERYAVDRSTMTARLTASYGSAPGVVTAIGGSVQSLLGGRVLVSFGTAGRVQEYDDTGRVAWEIEGNPGYVFRAQRISSLYTPGVGTSR